MKTKTVVAAALVAAGVCASHAQSIWRCGNTYSEQPCTGGAEVRAGDPRTADEAARSDAATRSQARAAHELEQARLARERDAPPASVLGGEPQAHPNSAAHGGAKKSSRRAKETPHFTAVAPRKQDSKQSTAPPKAARSKSAG